MKIKNFDDLMPCGECNYCNEYLDHSDLWECDYCNAVIHSFCRIDGECPICFGGDMIDMACKYKW